MCIYLQSQNPTVRVRCILLHRCYLISAKCRSDFFLTAGVSSTEGEGMRLRSLDDAPSNGKFYLQTSNRCFVAVKLVFVKLLRMKNFRAFDLKVKKFRKNHCQVLIMSFIWITCRIEYSRINKYPVVKHLVVLYMHK